LELLELYDIDEPELRSLLHEIPTIWRKNNSIFDSGLTPFFSNIGELETLIIGVHIFTHGNGAHLFIILTEYLKDARIATFNINAKSTTGWFGPTSYKKGEIKFREMLENLTYEEIETFSIENQYQESDEIFICPNCSAQYFMRILQVTKNGRVVCQNCNRSFDSTGLNVAQKSASHDS